MRRNKSARLGAAAWEHLLNLGKDREANRIYICILNGKGLEFKMK